MAESAGAHLVLVGLPGAGKSVVGAILADVLGRPFMDFDVEIERREGMSIPEIFALRGEAHFRGLEQALTAGLRGGDAMVLAPGGGWVTRGATVSLLRPPARLAWLRVTPRTAMRRMGSAASERPLLRRADPEGELERLLREREAAYQGADFVVDVEGIAPQRVAERIAEWVRGRSSDGSGVPAPRG